MAKRKGTRNKKPSSGTANKRNTVKKPRSAKSATKKSPTVLLTNAQYTRLYNRAAETRAKIRAYSKSSKYADYNIPAPEEYKIKALLARIEAGEKNADILREMRNLKPTAPATPDFVTTSGYIIPGARLDQLRKAIDKANANIMNARNRLPDVAKDVIPDVFDETTVFNGIISDNSITDKIEDLSLFKPSKLKIKAINEYGEAGTEAEVEYLKRILERENARRADLREKRGTYGKNQRFQRADDEAEFYNDIDIDSITSRDELVRKAKTWDDPARLARANQFITNYLKGVDNVESYYLNHGMLNDRVREKLDKIRDLASQYFNHEEEITDISFDVPDAAIQVVSGFDGGSISLDAIITAWESHLPKV